MALTKESRTIGGHTYTVTALGATAGRRAFARLVKLAGPALAEIGGANVGAALGKLASGLTDEDLDFFCDLFAANSRVNVGGKEPLIKDVFEAHFAANYLEMVLWLKFCLEVNFGSFFEGLGLRLRAAEEAKQAS